MLHTGRSGPVELDRDEVEAEFASHGGVRVEPRLCRTPNPPALAGPQRRAGVARPRTPCLNFDEGDEGSSTHDEVQLVPPDAPVPREHAVPRPFQQADGQIFALAPETGGAGQAQEAETAGSFAIRRFSAAAIVPTSSITPSN